MADPTIVVKGRYDGRALDSGLTRSAGKMSSFAKTAGRVAAVGLLAAGAAAVKFGVDAVKAASDAEESVNAVRVSYGKAADGILALGKNSATALGLSKSQLNSTAVQFSAFAQQIAGKGGDVVGTFKTIAGRATDFASVMNLDVNQALQIFQSGLAGETEPLRKFGIDLSAAAVQSFAYAKGIAKAGDELTEGQKVQARYQLLLKETAKTQGDFANTSDSLANRQRILAAQFEDVQAKLGKLLLPVATEFFGLIADKGIPALERAADWLKANRDEIERYALMVRNTVLPPVQAFGSLLLDLAKFFGSLPGPIQQTVLGLAALALVTPKVHAGVTGISTGLTGMTAKLKDAESRSKMLATAARGAAGTGGLLALSASTQVADDGLSNLLRTAGLAATGFAVGGPVGAAVGALGGLLLTLKSKSDATADSFRDSKPPLTDYASALDQVTGAATRSARELAALALQEAGAFEAARALGIKTSDLVKATTGNEAATRRVTAAIHEQTTVQEIGYDAMGNVIITQGKLRKEAGLVAGALGIETKAFEASQAKTRELAIATGELSRKLGEIKSKSKIEARIEARGYPETARDVANLVKGLDTAKSKKDITAVIKATGATATVADVQRILDKLAETKRAEREANRALGRVGSQRLNMDTYLSSLTGGINTAQQRAASGAPPIGVNLAEGAASGVRSRASKVASEAVLMVRAAITQARIEAQIASPSKKTRKIGQQLGDGLIVGVRDRRDGAQRSGVDLINAFLRGTLSGSESVAKSIDLITKAVERSVQMKGEEKREKEILRALKGRVAALRDVGKAQDRLNEKIRTERENLKGLIETRRQAAAATAENIKSYSALTNLISTEEGALNDAPSLLERMKQRLGDTLEFSRLVKSLRGGGLAEALVQQIEGAGVEGGLALAAAISAGGPAAVAEFNAIQVEIDKVSASIGKSSAASLYDAGIASAAGLVAGLESQQAKLEAWARKIGRSLVRALKDELGIRSPSKVTEEIGTNMLRGIQLGLSDTHARSLGTATASALVEGFGTPTLKARATLPEFAGSGGAGGGNTYKITVVAPVGSSKAEIGGEVVSLIKAYEKAGGRALAIG